MKTVYFRNDGHWKKVFGHAMNSYTNKEVKSEIHADESTGLYPFEFDPNRHDIVYFSNGEKGKTKRVLTKKLVSGISFTYCKQIKRYDTYFFNPGLEKTGSVNTVFLKDEKLLAYRGGKKKINIFVPYDYNPEKKYGVLFFFDAQNLFCHAGHYTSNADPYGGWQLDVAMINASKELGLDNIIVGIDNADRFREKELTMKESKDWIADSRLGEEDRKEIAKAGLDRFCDFLNAVVTPYIYENYSVDSSRIGIGGSSCGGLASFYAGLRDIDKYSYILSYSPAFFFFTEQSYKNFFRRLEFEKREQLPRVYLYCGKGDGLEEQLLPLTRKMKGMLLEAGYQEDHIKTRFVYPYPHNEASWRMYVPEGLAFGLKKQ